MDSLLQEIVHFLINYGHVQLTGKQSNSMYYSYFLS